MGLSRTIQLAEYLVSVSAAVDIREMGTVTVIALHYVNIIWKT